MARMFTIDEARELLPEVRQRADAFIGLRAEFAQLRWALQSAAPDPAGGIPELKALEARIDETLTWFRSQELQVKSIAPLLLDFPSTLEGREVLLCWLEGETELDWYHPAELGFMGRQRLPD